MAKPVLYQTQWEEYKKLWGEHAAFMFDILPDPPYFNYDKLQIHDRLSWRFNNYTRNQWNLKYVVPRIRRAIALKALVDNSMAALRSPKKAPKNR